MNSLLAVHDLRVSFRGHDDQHTVAVDGVSFEVGRGEMVALVGESGSGKTLTGLALPALLPRGAELSEASRISFDGVELGSLDARELRKYRGARVAMVFQDPHASLNPVMRIGAQIAEAIRAHQRVSSAAARRRAVELLTEVGIADPAARVNAWPHQLSGGMRQRVMIAIALASEPQLLIADEPTTALDVTVQAQILELLDQLRQRRSMAVLLITHDLAIVVGRADRVMVMYAGRIVEQTSATALFTAAAHPYTRGLLAAAPRLGTTVNRLATIAGAVPSPDRWPSGCRFHPRCPLAIERCSREYPPLVPVSDGHTAACWVTAPPEAT